MVLARSTQPEREPADEASGGEGMTNGGDHERNDDTRARTVLARFDPAQNASRPNRLPAARAWDHERNDDTPRADGARRST